VPKSLLEKAIILDKVIIPPTRDLGDGFHVRRALPAAQQRRVGPFVFFDQMGPARIEPGRGLDVRPHPHIGLATITYLFEGEILHRDSLGTLQPIRPGEVNWMTAGRGIVHSERTPPELRPGGSDVFGIQTWIALPQEHEEAEPAFTHHASSELPVIEGPHGTLRLIVGSLLGTRSPVKTYSEMFYADAELRPKAELTLPPEHRERAAYVVEGTVQLDKDYESGQLLVFKPGTDVVLRTQSGARLMLLGGEPLGPRHVWWNFVSSSKARIAEAAAQWKAGRFPAVPGETEFIPLPERGPDTVNYP
jgi:redox-sensitive bicupin YhaK (pirin superfamily)